MEGHGTPSPSNCGAWIDAVNEHGRDLTTWERAFMDNIAEQWDYKKRLSPRQVAILERIYTEKVQLDAPRGA